MELKGIIANFKKTVNRISSRNLSSHCKNLIERVSDLLDHGLGTTASDRLKEVIELCQQRKKGHKDKEYWWLYAMCRCLYHEAFSRFGRKTDGQYLEKAQEIAKSYDFPDVAF